MKEKDVEILEPRDYGFYTDNFDSEVVRNIILYSITRGNFKEVCKAFRDITYDQVSYYDEDNCSKIYRDKEKYSDTVIEQANYLQRKLSTVVDIYEQCITSGREFNWDYLYERLGK